MIYEVSAPQPNNRFLHITTRVSFSSDDNRILQLPVWRPGRYERGDFAQYVRNLRITDLSDNPLPFKKLGLSAWKVETDEPEILVRYEFWAGLLNAGSTFVSDDLIYINPLNCLMYKPGKEHESCELIVKMPPHFITACSMKEMPRGHFLADDFHTLADSPLIASDRLEKVETVLDGIPFRFWFCAPEKQDWKNIFPDAEAIIRTQLQTMKTFPTSSYEVLIHLLPYKAYHGVEHLRSTVITLGSAEDFFETDIYQEFLGVFSHELFHVWNVKSIRPAEMLPYDYARENISELGYVYEGITTYYGDLFCLRAGVFTWDYFSNLLSEWLTRHHHNFGRLVHSVAQSSMETWLDGYKPGVPDRRVNIYNEGALCALMADWHIRIKTQNRHSLDDVMRSMNEEFCENKKGYTRDDYRRHLEKWAGESMDFLFTKYIEGRGDYLSFISELASSFGLEIIYKDYPSVITSTFGIKIRKEKDRRILVDKLVPGSPAERAGISVDDELISANEIESLQDDPNWFRKINPYKPLTLGIISMGVLKKCTLTPGSDRFLPLLSMQKKEDASPEEKEAFAVWAGCAF
jgi:predicted metalloprotease with PDZ domain